MQTADIRCLYLYEGKCVPADGSTAPATKDAVEEAFSLCGQGADALLIVDYSDARDDKAHDAQIALIREIRRACGAPMAVCGNVERTEDIKKILYAGCDAALILPKTLSKGNARMVARADALFEEAKKRFGEDMVLYAKDLDDAVAALARLRAQQFPVPALSFEALKKNEQGLIPVITTDDANGEVLMLAYMNEEAYDKTFATGRMHYYSRERQRLWMKGEESGHIQYVVSVTADCDKDTLLARVRQTGCACHTGRRSCFFNEIAGPAPTEKKQADVLRALSAVIADRRAHPKEGSYTNYLFDKGVDKILKKLGEESTEIVIAAKGGDNTELTYEIADYLYHLLVLMNERGLMLDEVLDELSRR